MKTLALPHGGYLFLLLSYHNDEIHPKSSERLICFVYKVVKMLGRYKNYVQVDN